MEEVEVEVPGPQEPVVMAPGKVAALVVPFTAELAELVVISLLPQAQETMVTQGLVLVVVAVVAKHLTQALLPAVLGLLVEYFSHTAAGRSFIWLSRHTSVRQE
jgi:hypothetical protein